MEMENGSLDLVVLGFIPLAVGRSPGIPGIPGIHLAFFSCLPVHCQLVRRSDHSTYITASPNLIWESLHLPPLHYYYRIERTRGAGSTRPSLPLLLVLPYSPRRSRPSRLTRSFNPAAYPTVRLDRHRRLLPFADIARDTVVLPEPTPVSHPDPATVSPPAASRTPPSAQTAWLIISRDRVSTLCVRRLGCAYQHLAIGQPGTETCFLAVSYYTSFLHTAAMFPMDQAGKCVISCVALQHRIWPPRGRRTV